MAQLLAGLFGITLAEVGKSIGLGLVSAGTSKIFNLLVNSDPDEEVKNELKDLIASIQKMSETIANLEKNIAGMRLGIKTDLVQTYINEITALHDQYMAALHALAETLLEPDAKRRDKGFRKVRRRVADLGQRAADHIYDNVEQINVFLAGQDKASLIYLANQQAVQDSKDFMGHFVRMKTLMISMSIPQLMALDLLNYAFLDPEVNFVEAETLIDSFKGNLLRQDDFWTVTVGDLIVDLATRVIEQPRKPVAISFTWADKIAIYSSGDRDGSFYIIDDTEERKWEIEAINTIDPEKLDVENLFSFREVTTNATMDLDKGIVLLSKLVVRKSPDSKGQWFLRSTDSGLFQVRFHSILPLPFSALVNEVALQAVKWACLTECSFTYRTEGSSCY